MQTIREGGSGRKTQGTMMMIGGKAQTVTIKAHGQLANLEPVKETVARLAATQESRTREDRCDTATAGKRD